MAERLATWAWIGAAVRACVAEIAGAALFPTLAYRTLPVPAAITGMTGLSYVFYLVTQSKASG
jgi:hypothetical protein